MSSYATKSASFAGSSGERTTHNKTVLADNQQVAAAEISIHQRVVVFFAVAFALNAAFILVAPVLAHFDYGVLDDFYGLHTHGNAGHLWRNTAVFNAAFAYLNYFAWTKEHADVHYVVYQVDHLVISYYLFERFVLEAMTGKVYVAMAFVFGYYLYTMVYDFKKSAHAKKTN